MVILLVDNLIEDHDLKMAVEVSFFFFSSLSVRIGHNKLFQSLAAPHQLIITAAPQYLIIKALNYY